MGQAWADYFTVTGVERALIHPRRPRLSRTNAVPKLRVCLETRLAGRVRVPGTGPRPHPATQTRILTGVAG